MLKLRQYSLIIAEALDAWRIVPNMMIIGYGTVAFQLYIWFKSIPTYVQERCDPQLLSLALSKAMNLADAKAVACTVVDVVGGPTASQAAFVTTIIGLSTGIFGLYTATGRKWDAFQPDKSVHGEVDADSDTTTETSKTQVTVNKTTNTVSPTKQKIVVPSQDQDPAP